jgi:AraC family transcriptional regulator
MTQPQRSEPPSIPTSQERATSSSQGVEIAHFHAIAPQELAVDALPKHLIVIHTTPQPVNVIERADSLRIQAIAKPGDVNVLSAGSWASCSWDSPLSFVSLNILPAVVEQVAAQTDHAFSTAVDLVPTFHAHDAKLLQISQWLLDEVQTYNASGKLYLDSLVNLLTVHLLRTYTSQLQEPRSPQRLTRQQIRQAIDYLHANLAQDISLDRLAESVNISPSHLRRLFKQATGLAPHQYLLQLRVNRAKELLLTGSFSVGEVAAEVGFADQSHLHRHFKRVFGVTPKAVMAG